MQSTLLDYLRQLDWWFVVCLLMGVAVAIANWRRLRRGQRGLGKTLMAKVAFVASVGFGVALGCFLYAYTTGWRL